MIRKLESVEIPVDDMTVAIRWYVDTLGLEPRGTVLMVGGHEAALVGSPEQPDVALLLVDELSRHRDVQKPELMEPTRARGVVFSSTDLAADIARLRGRGAKPIEGPDEGAWGLQAVIRDPFGNELILLQGEPAP